MKTPQEIIEVLQNFSTSEMEEVIRGLEASEILPAIDIKETAAHLASVYKEGCRITPGGAIVELKKAEPIGNLDSLVKMSREPKTFQFNLHGRMVEVLLNPIPDVIAAECDRIGADVKPPAKTRTEGKGPTATKVPDGYDFEDKGYVEKMNAVYDKKRAFTIDAGLVDFKIPGATLDEKREWLSNNLPPHVIEVLFSAVRGVTSTKIEHALFI